MEGSVVVVVVVVQECPRTREAGAEQLIVRRVAADRLSDEDVGEAYESTPKSRVADETGGATVCSLTESYYYYHHHHEHHLSIPALPFDRVSQRWERTKENEREMKRDGERRRRENKSKRERERCAEVEREPSLCTRTDGRNFAPGYAPPRGGTRPSTGGPHQRHDGRDGTSHDRANRSDSRRGAVRRSPTLAESRRRSPTTPRARVALLVHHVHYVQQGRA